MNLIDLSLHNFRNFKEDKFAFSPSLTVIVGKNSQGKTNLLEAIHFILTGIGFREEKEEELIHFGKHETFVKGNFKLKEGRESFEINISKKDGSVSKNFFVNKTNKKHFSYKKELPGVVLFTPEQITIINGSPQIRRDYFNKTISLFDLEYKKRLNNFENALRRRNKVLEKHVNDSQLREELIFWDNYLIKESSYITLKRQEYIDYLNSHKKLDSKEFSIVYLKNEFTKKRLDDVYEKEKLIRKTLIGPQKDDFQIFVDDFRIKKDVHHFGSRSEERLAVFWLKINELSFYEKHLIKPMLLLDDIFSELDLDNKKIVLNLIEKYQTVATTTEKELLDNVKIEKEIIKL